MASSGRTVPGAEHTALIRKTHTPDVDTTTGRGLLIVQLLASRWSVERLTVGKTVWAELDLR